MKEVMKMKKVIPNNFVEAILEEISLFVSKYNVEYAKTERQLYAFFEIGCFLSLVSYYKGCGCQGTPKNLIEDRFYRYHTSPQGNPHNFSYMEFLYKDIKFELRQQIRIRSHINDSIEFTPDLVVIQGGSLIEPTRCKEYANGKREYYSVNSSRVIAAHESKNYTPFPELLVSFIGFIVSAHSWMSRLDMKQFTKEKGLHPAPILFTGGVARPVNAKMIKALQHEFPLNIIDGMHSGRMGIKGKAKNFLDIKMSEGEGVELVSPPRCAPPRIP